MIRRLAWALAAIVAGCAAAEAVLAGIGSDVGGWPASVAVLAALLAGLLALTRRAGRSTALLAPAAACLSLAYEYTYDSYYGPHVRRFADGGAIPVWWMVVLLAFALGLAGWAYRRPRDAGFALLPFVLVWIVILALAGDGH